MTKLFFLCRRRAELTHEQYVERLLAGHVPLALAHHPTLRRYVVNVVDGTRGPAPPGAEVERAGDRCDRRDPGRQRAAEEVREEAAVGHARREDAAPIDAAFRL